MSLPKTLAASAFALTAFAMVGCGSNSGSPNRYPNPAVAQTRSTLPVRGPYGPGPVGAGGVYVEEGVVVGGVAGGPAVGGGVYGGDEGAGVSCSARNLRAAARQCGIEPSQVREIQGAFSQGGRGGAFDARVFEQLGLEQEQSDCLRGALCDDGSVQTAPRRRRPAAPVEVPESVDETPQQPIRRKY